MVTPLLNYADQLSLMYLQNVKALKRVTMRCSAVLENPQKHSASDRVCFSQTLQQICCSTIKGYEEQVESIRNTLINPILALPEPEVVGSSVNAIRKYILNNSQMREKIIDATLKGRLQVSHVMSSLIHQTKPKCHESDGDILTATITAINKLKGH